MPEGNNPEGKVVARKVRGSEIVRLPEGTYHIVSTYLDTTGLGSQANASDAVAKIDEQEPEDIERLRDSKPGSA